MTTLTKSAGFLFATDVEPDPPTADEIEEAGNALVSELHDAVEDWRNQKKAGSGSVDVAGVFRKFAGDLREQ